jgi:hypothetical protein
MKIFGIKLSQGNRGIFVRQISRRANTVFSACIESDDHAKKSSDIDILQERRKFTVK